MTTLPAPSGNSAFLAARRIDVEEQALPFELALPLARVVYEHGGGPVVVPTKGVLTKVQAKALTAAGYLEMIGDADFDRPVLVRVLEGNQLELPFILDDARTLSITPAPAVPRYTWAAEVTEEGLKLVFGKRDVALVREDDPDDGPDDDEWDEDSDDDPDAGREPGPQDGCLGDLEGVAREVTGIWLGSSEFEFLEWAWWELGKRGLTAGDETDGTQWAILVARVGVLGAILAQYAAYAHGEGHPGEWRHKTWDLTGDYPKAGLIELGRAAERRGAFADSSDPWESPSAVMTDLIRREWLTVTRALLEEAGENFVVAGLWCASQENVMYPLADSRYYEATSASDDRQVDGHMWVSDGMPAD